MPGSNQINGTNMGTAGGGLLVFLANINSGDLLKTTVLSAVGVIVSFVLTLLLKMAKRKMKGPPRQ